jgi:DNA polymerase (family 10)
MSMNREIADIFDAMADILEIHDVPWKPRAYRAAASSLKVLRRDVADIYEKEGLKGLEGIPAIGEHLGEKIVEYLKKGKISEYEKLKKTLPAGVGALLKVPGLGPYRAENLYHHHIGSVADLKKAVEDHRLADIPGFGAKSEERIRESLGMTSTHGDRRSYGQVFPVAEGIVRALRQLPGVKRVETVGSLRRHERTIGDIDILVVSDEPKTVTEAFTALSRVERVVLHGPRKSEVILKDGLQVDLRVFGPKSFGAAMVYFTGDKQHNIELRKIAIRKGWKLNEYGLYDKKGRVLAGKTEEEVYEKLGFRWIPPIERHDQGEWERYAQKGGHP